MNIDLKMDANFNCCASKNPKITCNGKIYRLQVDPQIPRSWKKISISGDIGCPGVVSDALG